MEKKSIDLLVDAAVKLENVDLRMAYNLAAMAYENDPDNVSIKKIMTEYRAKLDAGVKKNVVIFANCQSLAIGRTLSESVEFTEKYNWHFIPAVQDIKTKEQIERLVQCAKTADVIIYQMVNNNKFPKEVNTNYVLSLVKESCKKISFPSLYFDGYFPHLSTMDGKLGPLSLVHDYFIASAYVLGLSESQTKSMILSDDLYDKDFSQQHALVSIENLSEREKVLDIKISDYLSLHFRERLLFNQFNHPKREVLAYVCNQLLQRLDVTQKVDSQGTGYLDGISTPVYPSTVKALELQFEREELYEGKNGKFELDYVISMFWEIYDDLGKEFVLSQIEIKKPFVLEIVAKFKSRMAIAASAN